MQRSGLLGIALATLLAMEPVKSAYALRRDSLLSVKAWVEVTPSNPKAIVWAKSCNGVQNLLYAFQVLDVYQEDSNGVLMSLMNSGGSDAGSQLVGAGRAAACIFLDHWDSEQQLQHPQPKRKQPAMAKKVTWLDEHPLQEQASVDLLRDRSVWSGSRIEQLQKSQREQLQHKPEQAHVEEKQLQQQPEQSQESQREQLQQQEQQESLEEQSPQQQQLAHSPQEQQLAILPSGKRPPARMLQQQQQQQHQQQPAISKAPPPGIGPLQLPPQQQSPQQQLQQQQQQLLPQQTKSHDVRVTGYRGFDPASVPAPPRPPRSSGSSGRYASDGVWYSNEEWAAWYKR